MQLGMVGLGRMGANLVRRLMRHGHECVAYDVNAAMIEQLEAEGATGARTLDEFIARLRPPRVAWVMVPAGLPGATVHGLASRRGEGGIVIDGGNSDCPDDVDAPRRPGPHGIHYDDLGT